MGRSVTCTYHCEATLANGQSPIYGAMNLKDAYGTGKSHAEAYNTRLVKVIVFEQTGNGRKAMKKDYLIIDCWNKIEHYAMQDKIPFYTFD